MLDLAAISELEPDESGIWTAPNQAGPILFPASGNTRRQEFELASFWYAHRGRVLEQLLKRYPAPSPFLDVGGGNGSVSLMLEGLGLQTVMLEPERNGALFARKRGLQHVACASLESARFIPGSFGSIGLFDVLEHIEDQASFLARVAHLLRSTGRLYLSVPAYRGLWSAADERSGHFRRYRLKELEAVVGKVGLEPLFSTYVFSALVLPVWAFRHLPYRLGQKKLPKSKVGGGTMNRRIA